MAAQRSDVARINAEIHEGYIRLINQEVHGRLMVVLLAPPTSYDLHWNQALGPKGRSQLCIVHLYRQQGREVPRSLCPGCELELTVRRTHYAPVLAPKRVAEGQDGPRGYEPALVQLPTAFLGQYGDKIKRGRIIDIHRLGDNSSKPHWQPHGMHDPERLPEPFDVLPVLMRITGLARLPEIPAAEVNPAPEAAPGAGDVLPFQRPA